MDRNFAFDGARGTAAIAVILFHIGHALKIPIFASGYLAVDFFFILSGYVIERSYGDRLRNGLDFRSFAEIRMARLFPLFFVGVLLGVVRSVGAIVLNDPRAPAPLDLAAQFLLNSFLLPAQIGSDGVFPLNTPAWTLSLEVAMNLLFAAYLFRAKSSVVAIVSALGAMGITGGAIELGNLDQGWNLASYWVGVSRVCFGFGVGILIARLAKPNTVPYKNCLPILLLIPLALDPGSYRASFDIFAATILFPAIIIAMSGASNDRSKVKIFKFLGEISYPIYALHYPLILPLLLIYDRMGFDTYEKTVFISGTIFIVACLAIKIDAAVRAFLSRRLHISHSARQDALRSPTG